MLKLVLPKGSLERATLELFEAADLTVRRSSSVEYKATIADNYGRADVLEGGIDGDRMVFQSAGDKLPRLRLTWELTLGYPPQVPGLSGFEFRYHFGSHLVRAAAALPAPGD